MIQISTLDNKNKLIGFIYAEIKQLNNETIFLEKEDKLNNNIDNIIFTHILYKKNNNIYLTLKNSNITINDILVKESHNIFINCKLLDFHMEKGTYVLIDDEGSIIEDPPEKVRETYFWNNATYISKNTFLPYISFLLSSTYDDLEQHIKICNKNHIKLNVRGGGASTANFNLNNNNNPNNKIILFRDGLSPSNFDNIELNENTHELTVGSGVRLGAILLYLKDTKYYFPSGSCSNVGIGGYTLGGGQPFINSYTGPACHYLKQVTYINAEGKRKIAEEDSETMKVIRGGGLIKPFVVTDFVFNLEKLQMPKNSSWSWALISINSNNDEPIPYNTIFKIIKELQDKCKNEQLLSFNLFTNNDGYVRGMNINFLSMDKNLDEYNYFNQFINFLSNLKISVTKNLHNNLNGLYDLFMKPISDTPWAGNIATMWEWGSDTLTLPEGKFPYHTVNRVFNSTLGSKIVTNLADEYNGEAIFNENSYLGFSNYYKYEGPYKNQSVYPPYKEKNDWNGWNILYYTNINNDDDCDDNDSRRKIENNMQKHLTNLVKLEDNSSEFNLKYSNYSPTYKYNDQTYYNPIEFYFNKTDIESIQKIKKLHDKNDIFISEFNVPDPTPTTFPYYYPRV